ncbi:obscurin-like [Colossoma macropomum]|uniref:obscurin-like n=1 Tax=Colossoma macropomum TaxID=42526 RepID=UPI0018640F0A|nr:obscurin-like [Colossoma macropomum]
MSSNSSSVHSSPSPLFLSSSLPLRHSLSLSVFRTHSAMDMNLFILSVFLVFARGQAQLKVSLFPGFPPHRLYVADEVTLRCKDGDTVHNNDVKWYKDGVQLSDNIRNGKLEIAAATVSDSGRYTCESGGKRSDEVEITVLDMVPLASLSFLNRAKTVLGKGGVVLMELYVEEGLKDWWCRYTEGEGEKWLPILPEKWTNSNRSVVTHADVQHVGDRIFWCMNTKARPKEERPRSNTVKLTATEKMVMLQISQRPAWSGDTVSLSCDVWGGAHVDQAVFYKDGTEIKKDAPKDTVVISNVAKSDQGMYACNATYRFIHISKEALTHSSLPSDQQLLKVIDGPPMAHLDCEKLYCECQKCRDSDSYRWHYTPPGETRTVVLEESDYYISSKGAGTYTCSAKFEGIGQSRHSNECILKENESGGPSFIALLVVGLFVAGLLILLVTLLICRRLKNQMSGLERNIDEGVDNDYIQH